MNRNVDAYIESLPDEKRIIADQLREMVLSLVPGIEEKFSFKIPFYHYHGMFCYLNEVKDGIELCLCRGKDLIEILPALDLKGRAIVASVLICTKKEIQSKGIEEIILTAANWQEDAKKMKRSMITVKKKTSIK